MKKLLIVVVVLFLILLGFLVYMQLKPERGTILPEKLPLSMEDEDWPATDTSNFYDENKMKNIDK